MGLLKNIFCGVFLMISIVNSSEYTQVITKARCQAKCNQKFGVQRNASSKAMFDVYRPYTCGTDEFMCLMCSYPCHGKHSNISTCQTNCRSDVCFESCSGFYEARDIVQENTRTLTLTTPIVVCRYTPLLTDQDMFDKLSKYRLSNENMDLVGDDNSSLVYIRWNVMESGGISTSAPLAFVISLKSRFKQYHSAWSTFAFTNFSFVPITGLSSKFDYNFRVTVVGTDGVVDEAKETGWTIMPAAKENVDPPKEVSLVEQYYKGTSVHALMKWTPGDNGGCYFKLYWLIPNSGKYQTQEIKEWSKFELELSGLKFDSEYTVEVQTYDKDFLHSSSSSANVTFKTLGCLNSTNHDYHICAPDKLNEVDVTIGPTYTLDDQEVADVKLNWTLPRYISPTNTIEHLFLTWRKEPSIALSKYIKPHHGDLMLPKTETNVTLHRLHWNSVYSIALQIRSAGGISEKSLTLAVLGNAYSDYHHGQFTVIDEYSNTSPVTINADAKLNADVELYFLILIPVILAVVALVIFLLYRRRILVEKKQSRSAWTSRIEEVNPFYGNPHCSEPCVEENDWLMHDDYEISMSSLHMTEAIGEGAFGRVFKASFLPADGRVVAVKILREHALPEEHRNLLFEIEAMKQLGHHQNLISIIACCTIGREICLVMDYCPLGDLRNFLRRCRETATACSPGSFDSGMQHADQESFDYKTASGLDNALLTVQLPYPDNKVQSEPNINPTTLLSYARQIVLGMEYLTQKKFVHRDLATRNILLSNVRMLKISDFGLTRDVYETNMYRPTSSRKLPYKWMPLETIFDQIFTVKSDVWSFGIVLWEIVTLGGCPYPGIPNEDLFKLLKDGYRMEKPDNCGQELYQMMLACWHPTSSNRPTFKQLRFNLDKLLEATQPYIDLNVAISEDYYKPDEPSRNDVDLKPMKELSFPKDKIELNRLTCSLSDLESSDQKASKNGRHVKVSKETRQSSCELSFPKLANPTTSVMYPVVQIIPNIDIHVTEQNIDENVTNLEKQDCLKSSVKVESNGACVCPLRYHSSCSNVVS